MENQWLTSKQAAEYLGMNEVHFRRIIIPQMQEMGIEGINKLSNARNSPWRVKVEALDEYMARERG